MFQLETWQVLTLGGMLVGGYAAISWRLLAVYSQRNDDRFKALVDAAEQRFVAIAKQIDSLAEAENKRGEEVLRLERSLGALRLEVFRDFTRREDHNRAIADIRIGMDNMSLRIEKALTNGGRLNV